MDDISRDISLERIEHAASVIDPVFRDTPQVSFEPLSQELGAEIVLKVETLNPVRCFKGRGGDYGVRCLPDKTPIVVASAGNFGQGVARAARQRGIAITVFAARNANPLKIVRMQDLGAEVMLSGEDFDAAKAAARQYADDHDLRFVEDGRDRSISEGAGSMAVELLRWPQPFDAILVALGNGAMINGIGTWVKAHAPETQIIGVCAEGAPAMERSWHKGQFVTTQTVDTISDGIGVRIPVPQALEDMRGIVDDVVLVDDTTTIKAMGLLLHHTGLLIEPSGAVGVAALMTYRERFADQLLATPLCGANVTREQFRRWFLDGA